MPLDQRDLDKLGEDARKKLMGQESAAEPQAPDHPTNAANGEEWGEDDKFVQGDGFSAGDGPYDGSEEPYDEQFYDDPAELLFDGVPDSPTKTDLEVWKKQYGASNIYAMRILGKKNFVFRTLSRIEWKRTISRENIDGLSREEIVCETCVLWPEGYNWQTMINEEAGIPSTLCSQIMERSGFTDEVEISYL